MDYKDLRSFLQVLENNDQLLRITELVWPEPDIGAAASAANKGLGETAPALMFENIRGFHKQKLATNVHGSWPNMALMLGLPKDTPPKKQFFEFSRRYQNFSKGTIEEKQTAPWQEVAIEENINLYELMPFFRLNAGDGGVYINKAAVISRHPDRPDSFNEQNVGMYRFQVKGPNRLSAQFVPEHDIARHFAAAERKNKPLPIAITLGNDPIVSIVAAMPLLYGQDEFQMASALREEPYPVVTLKNGLQVPWVRSMCWRVMSLRVFANRMDPMANSPVTFPACET
jgi:vanillate/4-hydroxybenzoate decarboxylase subunit C